ncbi:hypothetical protein [Mesorhizobium sp. WSM3859]|uniref:hypothetical protein n=1 Tax=Mesorhizobium sp. WSM3859 TaxID=2029402 RepID=UPI000BAF9D0F|nr:hypothetical protein [Mesorhizobium sp. WSM3859]PBC09387.1 hypothetical protein CK230_14655 [Mesorhizobium sp. WSM3859]
MTRIALAFAYIFCSTALVQAEAWQHFGVKEFGFIFDVPPGFALSQRSDRGAAFEGQRQALLAVWGARLGRASFEEEIEHRMMQEEKDGWKLTYRRLTPQWASYSGVQDGKIRYVRAIKVCDDRAALFTINYNRDEKVPYDPLVLRMVRSLKAEGC